MTSIRGKDISVCIVVIIGVLGCLIDSWAISFIQPQDPEIPWDGDPDISALNEDRLVQLWDEVVRGYRRRKPTGARASAMLGDSHYTPHTLSEDDREYLLNIFDQELHSDETDWNRFYTVLLLMNACMIVDSRIPDWVRYFAKLPRPIKMSDVRGSTYMGALQLLRVQNNPEAIAVLAEAVTREFWGDYPMHSRRLDTRCTEKSILSLRRVALHSLLHRINPEIGLTHLQKLAETHVLPPDCNADEESQFIRSIHWSLAFAQERQAESAETKPDDSGQE